MTATAVSDFQLRRVMDCNDRASWLMKYRFGNLTWYLEHRRANSLRAAYGRFEKALRPRANPRSTTLCFQRTTPATPLPVPCATARGSLHGRLLPRRQLVSDPARGMSIDKPATFGPRPELKL